MAIPSEADLLNDLNLLATYENLRRDGSFSRLLPLVAMLRQMEAVNVGGTTTDEIAVLEAIQATIGNKSDPIADKAKLLPDVYAGTAGTPYSEISLLKASLQGLTDITSLLTQIPQIINIVNNLSYNLFEGLPTTTNVSNIYSDLEFSPITKSPILISGKAVTASAYRPNYEEGNAATFPLDKNSGALLTYGRRLTTTDDAIKNQKITYNTSEVNRVPSNTLETIILDSNSSRHWASIENASISTLLIKLGTGVTTESYSMKIVPNSYKELLMPYSGIITGIWETVDGAAYVTEIIG